MTPLTFSILDFIELGAILVALVGAYWKLSTRQSLIEQRLEMLEHQSEVNETKLEKRLDVIDDKLDSMILELTRLKTKAED